MISDVAVMLIALSLFAGCASTDTQREQDAEAPPMGSLTTLDVDGKAVRAYAAGAFEPGTPGVLLFHAWWGLNADVTALADRLAASGFAVLAPDLYDARVATTIPEAEHLAGALNEQAADAVALAAADHLIGRLGPDAAIGTIGFSLGAAWALWLPAKRERIAATVVYYGTLGGPALAASRVPVLGHFAASDPYESEENLAAFERALRDAGREVTIHRYADTGHWFAEPSREAFRPEAAAASFERTVAFLRAHADSAPR